MHEWTWPSDGGRCVVGLAKHLIHSSWPARQHMLLLASARLVIHAQQAQLVCGHLAAFWPLQGLLAAVEPEGTMRMRGWAGVLYMATKRS